MARETRAARGAAPLIPALLGAAVLVLPVCAGAEGPGGSSRALRLDVPRVDRSFEPAVSGNGPVRSLAPARLLPNPRALRGSGRSAEDARLDLNLKGFSVLGLEGSEGARLKLRRVRERELRRPAFSVTFKKRF